MEKLYPVVKRSKTSFGYPIPEEKGFKLYYCPKCNRRLHGDKVDPNHYHNILRQEIGKAKELKPIYCQQCGSLIYPLPNTTTIEEK